jgi:hypothetical protein
VRNAGKLATDLLDGKRDDETLATAKEKEREEKIRGHQFVGVGVYVVDVNHSPQITHRRVLLKKYTKDKIFIKILNMYIKQQLDGVIIK